MNNTTGAEDTALSIACRVSVDSNLRSMGENVVWLMGRRGWEGRERRGRNGRRRCWMVLLVYWF